jgi:hypothetical protein
VLTVVAWQEEITAYGATSKDVYVKLVTWALGLIIET